MVILANKSSGFTLIEMLVVVSVITILSMIAVPTFVSQIKKLEAHSIANNIRTFLIGARHDAMIYQHTLTVCLADNEQKCVTNQGKMLISFNDKNGNNRFDTGIDTLRDTTILNPRYGELRFNVALNRHYVNFKPATGTPVGFMGNIKYCPIDVNTNNMFKVSFNKNGLITIKPHNVEATDC